MPPLAARVPWILLIAFATLSPLSLKADDSSLPEAIASVSQKLKIHAFDEALEGMIGLPDPDHPKAQLLKALLHEMGIGTEINADQALAHARQAAGSEDWEAAQYLAWRAITNPEGELNLKEAISWREKMRQWKDAAPGPRVLPETLLLPEKSSYQPIFEPATKWNHERARNGDAIAQYNMHVSLLDGRGIEPDHLRSMHWLLRAANAGNGPAASRLSFYYEVGIGVRNNAQLALKYLKIAAESGDSDAQHSLGRKLIRGRGVEKDPAAGMRWMEKAAASNHVSAIYGLAEILYEGELVEADHARAYSLYKRALDLGKSDARYDVAYLTFYGRGVQEDALEGIRLHEQSANEGNFSSAYQLAQIYLHGWKVDEDPEKAKFWAEKAVELGSDYAHFVLGMLLKEGLLGEADDEKAFYHFELAAREGHIKSQIEMGYHLLWGKGVERDLEESYSWYALAAENGSAFAAHWMLCMEGLGWGTPQNPESLLQYFRQLAREELDQDFVSSLRSAFEETADNQQMPAEDDTLAVAYEAALIRHRQSAATDTGIVPPRHFHSVAPVYPAILKLMEFEENITVTMVIGADGQAKQVEYDTEPLPQFKESFEAVLPLWRFLPALKDGEPVNAQVRMSIPFRLRKNEENN